MPTMCRVNETRSPSLVTSIGVAATAALPMLDGCRKVSWVRSSRFSTSSTCRAFSGTSPCTWVQFSSESQETSGMSAGSAFSASPGQIHTMPSRSTSGKRCTEAFGVSGCSATPTQVPEPSIR